MNKTNSMPHQYSWRRLRAGSFHLDGGGMFGLVPKVLWSKLTAPDDLNRIPLQTNCYFLDDGSKKILIETGFGDKWTDKQRGFYDLQRRTIADALREIDIPPETIDHVVVSHLHFDHAAGLTRFNDEGEPVPVFPGAKIHVQKKEWDDARADKTTMSQSYLESHLAPIADQVVLHEGETEIFPGAGLSVHPAPGHTWGQQAIRFADDQGVLVFPGDVMPTANHIGLAFNMGYDMEPYTNMLTKRRLLDDASRRGWRLTLAHEPGDAVVRVEPDPRKPDQFRLTPA